MTSPTGSATSGSSFTVGPTAPTISGFTPTVGALGTAVTISGTSFDATAANDVVALNVTRAQVSSASATSIATSVPSGSGSGKITVATASGKAVSSGDFFVPPSPYKAANVDFTARMAAGGISIEEVFERGTDRLVRHRIYGPQGEILRQTFRPYAKFGAP